MTTPLWWKIVDRSVETSRMTAYSVSLTEWLI
jgi:hypothetical protein